MNCISPPELEDRLLLAYLDGEADQNIALHLQRCPYCRERAKALALEQNILTSRLYRISCPSAAELGEFHLRMLSSNRMLVISQHLRECPHCVREIEQLKGFLNALSPVSKGNLLQQTKRLIAQLASGRGRSGAVGEPSFALRGEEKGPLTFESEGVVIVLDIQPANEGKVNILGQVAADDQDDWTGATVILQPTNEEATTVFLDDLGAFRFEGVSSGSIQITISSLHGVEVRIPNIDV